MRYHTDDSQAIGWEVDGRLTAGIIYEQYNGRSMVVHIAAEAPFSKSFVRAIFDYAYRVCGIEKSIAPVVETNVRSRRLVEHMGFIPEARLSNVDPQGDVILYTLHRDACRYLGNWGQREQERTLAAAAS